MCVLILSVSVLVCVYLFQAMGEFYESKLGIYLSWYERKSLFSLWHIFTCFSDVLLVLGSLLKMLLEHQVHFVISLPFLPPSCLSPSFSLFLSLSLSLSPGSCSFSNSSYALGYCTNCTVVCHAQILQLLQTAKRMITLHVLVWVVYGMFFFDVG